MPMCSISVLGCSEGNGRGKRLHNSTRDQVMGEGTREGPGFITNYI